MTIRLDNLAKLIRGIHDLPDENFNMGNWAVFQPDQLPAEKEELIVQCGNGLPPCGTVYCIAGTAVLLQDSLKLRFNRYNWNLRGELIGDDSERIYMAISDQALDWLIEPGNAGYPQECRMVYDLFIEQSMYGSLTMDSVTKQDVLRTLAALWADPGAFLDEYLRMKAVPAMVGAWATDEGNDYWVEKIVRETPSPWKGLQQTPTE